MKTKSQDQRIFEWLFIGHTLTQLEALKKFNSLRLGAVIFRLRKLGWKIETKLIKTPTHKRVARYRMVTK